jgi:hypothetical protein
MKITEELLMAYADGEADAEARAAIEAAMARDAALRERVETHRRLRGRLAGAFGAAMTDPVPERLHAAARGEASPRPMRPAEIVDLAAVRARKAQPKPAVTAHRLWVRWGALAACLAIGVIMARGLAGGGATPMIGDRHGALMAQGALAQALDQQVTGASGAPDAAVRIGVSFRAGDKSLCRTFQTIQGDGLAGVACHAASGWQVRVAAASPVHAVGASGYRTAASALPPAVTATVDALIEGAPLDAQAEAVAKAKGWRD